MELIVVIMFFCCQKKSIAEKIAPDTSPTLSLNARQSSPSADPPPPPTHVKSLIRKHTNPCTCLEPMSEMCRREKLERPKHDDRMFLYTSPSGVAGCIGLLMAGPVC